MTAMEGKTILITGGNSGIGKATALELAILGAEIVLGCRSLETAEQARQEIVELSNNTRVTVLPLDLNSFDSIHGFATEFRSKFPRIHVLINCAGVFHLRPHFTDEGFEAQFGVNYLGHFLLTHLLLDHLRRTAPSRIINVSSSAHTFGKIDFDNLRCEKGFGPTSAYAQSKLANILFTRALAHRVKHDNISVFCLHPGVVATNLLVAIPKWLKPIAETLLKTPKSGAETSVFLATEPDIEPLSGEYFVNKKVESPSTLARHVELQEQLWHYSASVCHVGEAAKKRVAILG